MLTFPQFLSSVAQIISKTDISWLKKAAVSITLTSVFTSATVQAQDSPSERVSFNADWRFQKSDPAEVAVQLDYQKIKDWVMAAGNELTSSPDAATHTRPAGNLVENISYTQSSFDDSGWR